MAQTLPTGEQIRFRSSKTGEHILDTYMESVEKGTRSLYDLIGDLFDDSGVFRVANFEFRFDASTDKLQVRVGNFSNSTSGWSDLTTFFSIEGTFSSSTSYNNFDIVTLSNKDVYIVHGLSSAATYADEAAFISSSNTEKIIDVSGAKDWAIKTDGQVASTDYSSKAWAIGGTGVTDTASKGAAKEWAIESSGTVDGTSYSSKEYAQGTQASTGGSAKSWAQDTDQVNGASTNDRSAKAWAQGASMTGSTLGGSSKDWAQLTGSTVDGTNYSAKHWATTGNVATVVSNISDINAVAGKATEIGLLGVSDVITDMGILGTSANVTAMGHLGTSANVTAMGHLGTSANVTAMGNLGTSANVTNMANLNATNVITHMANLNGTDVIANMAALNGTNVISNIATVAGKASLITSDFASDLNTLATTTIIEDLNILATSDIVTDLGILATSANVTNMATLGASGVVGNIASVAGISTEVAAVQAKLTEITNVNGALTNINTVATNLTNVNAFANTYFIASSAPGSPTAGDLWYDTNNNILKTYNGSAFVTLISTADTDDISEGSSNLYFTNARADTRADGRITAALAANVTLGGELRGPASFVIDPATIGDNTGTVVIKGNLQVDGTTTTVNSTTMAVSDLNITAAKDAGNAAAANGGGLTIAGANATLTYANSDDSWNFNKKLKVNAVEVATDSDVTALAIALGG